MIPSAFSNTGLSKKALTALNSLQPFLVDEEAKQIFDAIILKIEEFKATISFGEKAIPFYLLKVQREILLVALLKPWLLYLTQPQELVTAYQLCDASYQKLLQLPEGAHWDCAFSAYAATIIEAAALTARSQRFATLRKRLKALSQADIAQLLATTNALKIFCQMAYPIEVQNASAREAVCVLQCGKVFLEKAFHFSELFTKDRKGHTKHQVAQGVKNQFYLLVCQKLHGLAVDERQRFFGEGDPAHITNLIEESSAFFAGQCKESQIPKKQYLAMQDDVNSLIQQVLDKQPEPIAEQGKASKARVQRELGMSFFDKVKRQSFAQAMRSDPVCVSTVQEGICLDRMKSLEDRDFTAGSTPTQSNKAIIREIQAAYQSNSNKLFLVQLTNQITKVAADSSGCINLFASRRAQKLAVLRAIRNVIAAGKVLDERFFLDIEMRYPDYKVAYGKSVTKDLVDQFILARLDPDVIWRVAQLSKTKLNALPSEFLPTCALTRIEKITARLAQCHPTGCCYLLFGDQTYTQTVAVLTLLTHCHQAGLRLSTLFYYDLRNTYPQALVAGSALDKFVHDIINDNIDQYNDTQHRDLSSNIPFTSTDLKSDIVFQS